MDRPEPQTPAPYPGVEVFRAIVDGGRQPWDSVFRAVVGVWPWIVTAHRWMSAGIAVALAVAMFDLWGTDRHTAVTLAAVTLLLPSFTMAIWLVPFNLIAQRD